MKKTSFIIFLLLALLSFRVWADEIYIESHLNHSTVGIGEPIRITVKIHTPLNYKIIESSPPYDSPELVLSFYDRQEYVSDKKKISIINFEYLPFTFENVIIPLYSYLYTSSEEGKGELFLKPANVAIKRSISPDISEIKDLKPLLTYSPKQRDYIMFYNIVLISVLFICVLFLFRSKKRKPARSRNKAAQVNLNTVDKINLLFENQARRSNYQYFYSQLSIAYKELLNEIYEASFNDKTSSEIVECLKDSNIEELHIGNISDVLSEFDNVKFANDEPSFNLDELKTLILNANNNHQNNVNDIRVISK